MTQPFVKVKSLHVMPESPGVYPCLFAVAEDGSVWQRAMRKDGKGWSEISVPERTPNAPLSQETKKNG